MKPATQPVTQTPGPWELDSAKDGDSRYFVIHGQIPAGINADFGYPVADTMNRHHCVAPDEDEANARLISSAPQLLRVAKDAADFLLRTARVLDEWAVQSQNGGWSTHQVEGNLRVANDCRREADCIQRVIDRATGAEGTRP
jgi:hypothetical protein